MNEEITNDTTEYEENKETNFQSELGSSRSFESHQSSSKLKKKKAKIPVSIEEVVNKISVITSANINPPPAKIVLTPRSAEVCLKFGINPEILKVRDIDSFWESGIDPSVQRLRHEAYVQRRHELMKQCRHERKKLINAELNNRQQNSLSKEQPSIDEMMKQQQDEMNATIIETEKLRLEKLKRRQEKELEQMLQYEMNRVKSQKEVQDRIELAKKQEAMKQKQKEKRMKLVAEERRLRELQRRALVEAEEIQAKELVKQITERENLIAEEQQRKLEQQKESLRQQEEENKRKNAEHRLQLQKFFTEQQNVLHERLSIMEMREKQKEAVAKRQQQEKHEKMVEKRNAIEERIERNIQAAEMMEEKRKNDFIQKQTEFEEARIKHLEKLEEARLLKIEEQKLQEQRRRMIILQQQRDEERKKIELLEQFEENEQNVETLRAMRAKELEILRERRNLRMQMKSENVVRVKRVNDYTALKTMKKIEENDRRTEYMLQEKQTLIQQRRQFASQARIQKQAMLQAMDRIRTDADKADEVIKKVLSGKASISDVLNQTNANKTSTKTKKKKKNTAYNDESSATLIGLSRTRTSQSAPSAGEDYDAAIEMHTQLKNNRSGPPAAPVPYISPYDTNFAEQDQTD